MKNLKTYLIAGLAVATLASCSSNQELVNLEEYDDLYFTGNRSATAAAFGTGAQAAKPVAQSSTPKKFSTREESLYYGNTEWEDVESLRSDQGEFSDDDYFDPEYADKNSVNPNVGGFGNQNMNMMGHPRMNMHMGMGMGMGGWGMSPMMGFGMSFGSPMMMGPRWGMGMNSMMWCDPFWDPFCMRSPFMGPRWGMGMGMGMAWGNPWINP